MKPISYKQETGDRERICTREGPQGPGSVSPSGQRERSWVSDVAGATFSSCICYYERNISASVNHLVCS